MRRRRSRSASLRRGSPARRRRRRWSRSSSPMLMASILPHVSSTAVRRRGHCPVPIAFPMAFPFASRGRLGRRLGQRWRRLLGARHRRVAGGGPQAELGEKVGTDAGRISRYEGGRITPSLDALMRIAEVFNVSADHLLFDDVPRRPCTPPRTLWATAWPSSVSCRPTTCRHCSTWWTPWWPRAGFEPWPGTWGETRRRPCQPGRVSTDGRGEVLSTNADGAAGEADDHPALPVVEGLHVHRTCEVLFKAGGL